MNRRSLILSILASPLLPLAAKAETPKTYPRTWSIQSSWLDSDGNYWIAADKIRFVRGEWQTIRVHNATAKPVTIRFAPGIYRDGPA